MVGKKKRERVIIVDEARITSEVVGDVMRECLKGSFQMPSAAAIKRLASILEDWRQHYIGSRIFDPLKKEAGVSAKMLLLILIKMKQEYEVGIYNFPELRSKVDAIDRAVTAIHSLHKEGIAVETAQLLGWKWLSNALPDDFAEAIRTTNPGREIGISDDGPLSRFIAAIAPHLTGEHPTARSVSTQLKLLRKSAFDR